MSTDDKQQPSTQWKFWREARVMELEPYYCYWVSHLTSEGLHDKADIATVLAILHQQRDDMADDARRLHKDKMALIDEKITAAPSHEPQPRPWSCCAQPAPCGATNCTHPALPSSKTPPSAFLDRLGSMSSRDWTVDECRELLALARVSATRDTILQEAMEAVAGEHLEETPDNDEDRAYDLGVTDAYCAIKRMLSKYASTDGTTAFHFDRFRGGKLMAEGIVVHAATLEEATAKAERMAYRGDEIRFVSRVDRTGAV